jgi:Protein of unknown function (DUF3168)
VSIETDFRALLAGHAPLTALVGNRIAQDAIAEGSSGPLVVFSSRHDPTLGLNNAVLADTCTLAVQCWADTGAQAAAVAAAVKAAIATAPADAGACVLDESTTHDPEIGLDGVLLTVEWWA